MHPLWQVLALGMEIDHMARSSTSFQTDDPRSKRGGRPKGAKAKYDRELAERLAETGEVTPLDVMLAMMNDSKLPAEVRIRAAAAAAPYVHRRKPVALEVT